MKNTLPTEKKRIAVAMSGGVDSSVTAFLLKKAGHDIVGFTAWTLNGPGKCCNDALVNAGRVCEMLSIPYDTIDLRAEFSHYVMDYYHDSYKKGLTPNPCVECNRYVKWEKLVEYASITLQADYIATGHYAKINHTTDPPGIFRSEDENKDQTYMMARVKPKDLQYTLFPLGDMTKPQVYEIAKELNIPEAYSKESQDICFVLNGQANYMKGVFGHQPGPIVDWDTGKTLGQHEGHFQYTIGQRKGVKVAAGRPIYVIQTDPKTNTVYVGDKHHLEEKTLQVMNTSWLVNRFEEASQFPLRSMVKIRYNTPPKPATVYYEDRTTLRVEFDDPILAITPGQIAAFYDSEFKQLLGGGYIENHIPHEKFNPRVKKEVPDLNCQLAPA